MKVAFDHQIFTLQTYGGISRYFVRLAEELIAHQVDVNVLASLHVNAYLKELPVECARGWRVGRYPPKTTPLFIEVNRQLAALKMRKFNPHILHETYYSRKSVQGAAKGRILTVYDMIHEKFASEFFDNDNTSKYKRDAVSRADHIICISHSTKKDLCELFDVPSEKVTVVYLGFERFKDSLFNKVANQATPPYLLYVGNRSGYKNFKMMLKAVASSHELMKLFDIVAFGGGPFSTGEQQLILELGFAPSAVRQISGDDSKLGMLYSNAAAFIYPSQYEGFGLPPLEAMAHGCPVVASNTSSIPEVVGMAGQYFDPADMDALADAIVKVVFNEKRKSELVLNGNRRAYYHSKLTLIYVFH